MRRYVYRYAREGGWWLELFPFAWLKIFIISHEDALASTARQFPVEPEADGLFAGIF